MLLKRVIQCSSALLVGLAAFHVYKVVKDELDSTLPHASKVENLAYEAETVHIKTQDNILIAGSYAPSKNGATIVLIHGYRGSRKQLENLGKLLVDNGFGVLGIDLRGNGESQGAMIDWGENEALDIKAALDLLESRGADRSKIGAYGFSIGAFVLARAAAHEERLKSLVLASVPTRAIDLAADTDGGGITGLLSANIRMLVDERVLGVPAYGVGVLDTIRYLAPRPILIIGGGADKTVSESRLREVYAAAREPKTLEIFPGAGHGDYDVKYKERYESLVLEYFRRTLDVPTEKQSAAGYTSQ